MIQLLNIMEKSLEMDKKLDNKFSKMSNNNTDYYII